MRALVCHVIDDMDSVVLGDLPEPAPGPGEILIDVAVAGVNFADLLVLKDQYQFRSEPPFAPGMEAAGVVVAVGSDVDHVAVGDRVAVVGYSGAFAQRWAVDATMAVSVPDDIPWGVAASLSIGYGTSYHALKQRAAIEPGETILVLGAAGGVGSSAVELAVAMGARVIAAASSAEKTAFCRELGAHHVINYVDEDHIEAEDDDYWALGWYVNFDRFIVPDRIQFYHHHNGLQSFQESSDLVIKSWTGFRFPIYMGIVASTEAEIEYEGAAPDDVDKKDTTYRVKLGYQW